MLESWDDEQIRIIAKRINRNEVNQRTSSSTVATDASQQLFENPRRPSGSFPALMRVMVVCNVLVNRAESFVSETLKFLLNKYARISILGGSAMARSIKVLDLDVWTDCSIPDWALGFADSGQPWASTSHFTRSKFPPMIAHCIGYLRVVEK